MRLIILDLVEFFIVDTTLTDVDLEIKHPMHLHGHKYAVVAMHDVI